MEWLHRKRCCAPGLWPLSGTKICAAQVWGFADPEPAEGSHGCALLDPDYRNLVGEKGWHGKTLSEREGGRTRESARQSLTPARTGFYRFSGHVASGWSSLSVHRFTAGDCILQTTKGRRPLITSKTRMSQLKGEPG